MIYLLSVIVGGAGFIAAAALGWRNFQYTRGISMFWVLFTLSTIFGALWSASLGIEIVFGFESITIELAKTFFGGMVILATAAAITDSKREYPPAVA